MAHSEDCSTVLEQFVHDVANLPAEINHLMEEIQAKDKIIQECRAIISSRDASLQKFIKLNGSHTLNPKEESYSNAIIQNMDRCQILQDEKIALSEKAAIILDRHVKKLDIKIRDLQNDGLLSSEPPIPSLFNLKDTHRDPTKSFLFAESAQADTYPSALNPSSGNAALPANLLQRLNSAAAAAAGVPGAGGLGGRNSAPATPAAAALHFQQRQRESSAGATENKRRKLNASLGNLPAAPSGLRQSSLGPGTPKPGTPGATRAGSAGPRAAAAAKKASIKKVAPHQQIRKIKAGATASKSSKRSSSNNGRLKAGSGNASRKKSPASAASVVEEEDESMLSSADLSDSENNASRRQAGRDSDEEMEDEEDETGEDTKVYCTCRSVSHGDMVACDNDNCPYEWFHWKCVGLTREPLGTWYCEECRRNLGK